MVLLLESKKQWRSRVRLFPSFNVTVLGGQLLVDFFSMIKIVGHGRVDLSRRQVRIFKCDLLCRPASPEVICHNHGDARPCVAVKPRRLAQLFYNVRIYCFHRHVFIIAAYAGFVNLGHLRQRIQTWLFLGALPIVTM